MMIASRHLHRQAVTCKSVPARLCIVRGLRCSAGAPADRGAPQMAPIATRGALVWLRNDLRVTDHEGLRAAAGEAQHLSAVYCLDGGSLMPRRSQAECCTGLPRLGPHRLRFILEALQSLRSDLERLGSTLLFSTGDSAAVVADHVGLLARVCDVIDLHYQPTLDPLEQRQEDAVLAAASQAATSSGSKLQPRPWWGATLHDPRDVQQWFAKRAATDEQPAWAAPVSDVIRDRTRLTALPAIMTDFRKAVEAAPVPAIIPAPASLPPPPPGAVAEPISSSIASLYESASAGDGLSRMRDLLGTDLCDSSGPDPRSARPPVSGETAGMQRLRYFLWGDGKDVRCDDISASSRGQREAPILTFKDTRMLAFGVDNSAKLSAYLAAGCISPRMVYAELRKAAAVQGSQQCAWLEMHLTIREFFVFTAMKAGPDLLRSEGINGRHLEWRDDAAALQRWARGATGLPFVDACMRELAATGYMSNRGRQNVASLFCKDMEMDWRLGADVFESLLVDHDWAVNTSNWAYFAGVGNDPRNRRFNTVSQGEKYDVQAELITAWVPELAELPVEHRHRPWEADGFSSSYPSPIVDVVTQINRVKAT